MNPTIADMATQIIARNGFSDRVRVIAKHSDTLDVQADLGGPMDILVSEIVSNNLLGEDVLPAHERAVRNLLKPGGRVIPARGAIRVALAEDMRDRAVGRDRRFRSFSFQHSHAGAWIYPSATTV